MYLNRYLINIGTCLLLTVVIEIVISFAIGLRKKDLINVFLVNILTNPLLNSIYLYFGGTTSRINSYIILFILEVIVLFVEGYIYKKVLEVKKINSYLLSLILNISSFLLGNIIIYLLGGIWKKLNYCYVIFLLL